MKSQRELTDEGRAAIRPTPQRHRHDAIEVPAVDRSNPTARPARVETQTTIDRYKRRKTLTEDQLSAAYRWHALAERSSRFPKSTMSWQGTVNGSSEDLHDAQVSAGIQRDAGITYLNRLDTDFTSIVDHVCVHDFAAESWAIRRDLHPMRGIKTLRLALDRLCKHYGITR
jgi:hypothetical protein